MPDYIYYIATLLVFFCIYCILSWGLNIQFGYTGILDFTFITFVAAGAYFAGVTAMGGSAGGFTQTYILGWTLPFPVPVIFGALVAAAVGLLVGFVALRRLRSDYLAIVTVSVGTIAWTVVGNDTTLFNGWDGVAGVPAPLNGFLQLDPNTYILFFAGLSLLFMLLFWLVANRLFASPLGRTLRSIREDADAAAVFGKNVFRFRMLAMVVGCIFAGVGGALLIEFTSAWNPSGWTVNETFVVWAALLVGGRANNRGMILGSLLVPIVFVEVTRFLPSPPGHPDFIAAARNIVIGVLLVSVLWFRPQGLIPERRQRLSGAQ